jgi:hypothetical protein
VSRTVLLEFDTPSLGARFFICYNFRSCLRPNLMGYRLFLWVAIVRYELSIHHPCIQSASVRPNLCLSRLKQKLNLDRLKRKNDTTAIITVDHASVEQGGNVSVNRLHVTLNPPGGFAY